MPKLLGFFTFHGDAIVQITAIVSKCWEAMVIADLARSAQNATSGSVRRLRFHPRGVGAQPLPGMDLSIALHRPKTSAFAAGASGNLVNSETSMARRSKGRRKVGRKKRRMRSRIRHRK
jgi:hypothetical protein